MSVFLIGSAVPSRVFSGSALDSRSSTQVGLFAGSGDLSDFESGDRILLIGLHFINSGEGDCLEIGNSGDFWRVTVGDSFERGLTNSGEGDLLFSDTGEVGTLESLSETLDNLELDLRMSVSVVPSNEDSLDLEGSGVGGLER